VERSVDNGVAQVGGLFFGALIADDFYGPTIPRDAAPASPTILTKNRPKSENCRPTAVSLYRFRSGVEIVRDQRTKEEAADLRKRPIVRRCSTRDCWF